MTSSTSSEEKNSRFELKTVLDTTRILLESRSKDFILQNLLLITMGKLLVPKAGIFLFDNKSGLYSLAKKKGSFKMEEGDTVDLSLKKSHLNKSQVEYQECQETIPDLISNMNGCLFFNLRTVNRHIGFLFISKKAINKPFLKSEIEFVESLSIISSAAIANSEMFDELKATNQNLDHRIHELNTLFDLSKEFNLLVDREKISRIFKFALLGQLFVRSFFLLYKNADSLEVLASSNLSDPILKETAADIFALADNVVEIDNKLADSYPLLKKNDIAALIEISIQNQKIAVIGVGKRVNNKPFTGADFNFLKSLSNLAVISIQKTYFLEERIEKERIEEELSIAKAIQDGLLPNPIPKVDGLDLSAITISSSQVGGDYFDIAQTPDSNFVFAIADVTGKGFPAALLMANLQSMLHVLLPVDITLAQATERINNLIFKNTPSDKFITFFWGKYLKDQQVFRYVNAGHNPPLHLPYNSNEFQELNKGGLLLGALQSMTPYKETDIPLQKGDLVILYTDGVNEAQSEKGDEEFGEERLKECILKYRERSVRYIQDQIIREVNQFTDGHQFDDLTLLIFKVS